MYASLPSFSFTELFIHHPVCDIYDVSHIWEYLTFFGWVQRNFQMPKLPAIFRPSILLRKRMNIFAFTAVANQLTRCTNAPIGCESGEAAVLKKRNV